MLGIPRSRQYAPAIATAAGARRRRLSKITFFQAVPKTARERGGIFTRTLARSSMRELLSFLSRLPERLQAALAASRPPHRQLLSISMPLAVPTGPEALPPDCPHWFYWNEPARNCLCYRFYQFC